MLGSSLVCPLLVLGGCDRTGVEAKAVASRLQNIAAMGEAVERYGSYIGVAKDRAILAEAEVSSSNIRQFNRSTKPLSML